jgi:LAS superfamily LD-carboxypeptidase LdcB
VCRVARPATYTKACAPPGKSNHNGGLAVDIQDANSWRTAMTNNGWTKLGDWDPMHYDYNGS